MEDTGLRRELETHLTALATHLADLCRTMGPTRRAGKIEQFGGGPMRERKSSVRIFGAFAAATGWKARGDRHSGFVRMQAGLRSVLMRRPTRLTARTCLPVWTAYCRNGHIDRRGFDDRVSVVRDHGACHGAFREKQIGNHREKIKKTWCGFTMQAKSPRHARRRGWKSLIP